MYVCFFKYILTTEIKIGDKLCADTKEMFLEICVGCAKITDYPHSDSFWMWPKTTSALGLFGKLLRLNLKMNCSYLVSNLVHFTIPTRITVYDLDLKEECPILGNSIYFSFVWMVYLCRFGDDEQCLYYVIWSHIVNLQYEPYRIHILPLDSVKYMNHKSSLYVPSASFREYTY
jgi:hypothetical protein